MRMGENCGHNTCTFWRANMRLSELNALLAPTRIAASVSLSSKIFFMACIAASASLPVVVCLLDIALQKPTNNFSDNLSKHFANSNRPDTRIFVQWNHSVSYI